MCGAHQPHAGLKVLLPLFMLCHPNGAMDADGTGTKGELVTIAEHFRSDPHILSEFRPGVLRSLVANPASLPLLPLSVLDRVINDPIFGVNLPKEALKEVTGLIMEAARKSQQGEVDEEGSDATGSGDYDYSDYDYNVDYGPDEAIGDFVKDLDPEFLKTISPSLLLSYFESASPTDILAILTDSAILLSLPPDTIVQVLQKLPRETLDTVLHSAGVRDLYSQTAATISHKELERTHVWQLAVVTRLIEAMGAAELAALPGFLVRSQLGSVEVVAQLLEHPGKLAALVAAHPDLLAEVPQQVIAAVLLKKPEALEQVGNGASEG
jgi:hypothetical protein